MNNLDPYSFFFETPLYLKIKITEDNFDEFVQLGSFSSTLHAYSPSLKENTTYECVASPESDSSHFAFHEWTRSTHFVLECKRTKERLFFYVYWDKEQSIFQKIGQYPSIADLNISQIKKYNKVLDKESLKEFTRAIGLATNGVGIGSFVYLRRIFERLIAQAYMEAKPKQGLKDEDYNKLRIAERIELLKEYLPDFLSENKNLYSILSVGIHSLQENQCLQYFDVVKVGIELILDEKVEKHEKKLKIEEAKKRIEAVNSQIAKK